ncbi:hypothetical protein SY88_05020 [Clostridiales bacterium PH28_bin88]|nr:hypothetical protein SY88_05020 [Clostridiales bacterium PH28_bin88]
MSDHNDYYYHKVGGFINRIAPWYDALVGPAMQSKAVRAAGMLGEIKDLEVLDACTGTGILAYELARRGARVTAIDLSPAMLQRARKKLRGSGPRFELQDAARMSFPDNTFHISTISMALHEMPPEARRKVLSEMNRVTTGRVVVVDWVKVPANPVWRWGVSLVERLEGGFYHEFIRSNLENLLLETGFFIEEYAELDTIGIFLCQPKT